MIELMTGLHEECGVFGVYSPQTTDVAAMTYAALYALQHRGQESCGIVVNDRGIFSHDAQRLAAHWNGLVFR